MATTKLSVGISMLADTRDGDFDTAYAVLQKILGNIVANPSEPKYRSLKKSNAKINALLQTSGVRVTLVGAGFVEEGDMLRMPDEVSSDGAQAALQALAQQAADRVAADAARKAALEAERKETQDKENEERKRMKAGIEDDAAARKEPGWKAKAAGVKEGKAITGCSDIGVGNNAGG